MPDLQPQWRHGAVLDAYAETDALDVRCSNCDAEVGEFCRNADGGQRRIPCPRRITATVKAQEEKA